MDAKDNETEIDRFIGGWPGVITGVFAIAWMLLVANGYFSGIGWILGQWGKLIDVLPGLVAIYMFGFGILGEDTMVGRGVRTAWAIFFVGLFVVSCLGG